MKLYSCYLIDLNSFGRAPIQNYKLQRRPLAGIRILHTLRIYTYLADVTGGVTAAAAAVDDGTGRGMSGGRREQRDAVVPAGKLVGGVDGGVAAAAERGLVGAAQHRRLRALARVAPDLHARGRRDAHPRAHTAGAARDGGSCCWRNK